MTEKLSSSLTIFYKIAFPITWILFFGLGTLVLWTNHDNTIQNYNDKWRFLIAWIAATSFMLWFSLRLKEVNLSNDRLLVDNYITEIEIPISNVKRVKEIWLFHPHTIKLTVDPPSKFGSTIVFVPRFKFDLKVWGSPVAQQLKELINKSNAPAG